MNITRLSFHIWPQDLQDCTQSLSWWSPVSFSEADTAGNRGQHQGPSSGSILFSFLNRRPVPGMGRTKQQKAFLHAAQEPQEGRSEVSKGK